MKKESVITMRFFRTLIGAAYIVCICCAAASPLFGNEAPAKSKKTTVQRPAQDSNAPAPKPVFDDKLINPKKATRDTASSVKPNTGTKRGQSVPAQQKRDTPVQKKRGTR